MARIGFTSTMSCGKTTIVNALKELPEFKGYQFSTERSKYLRDLGIPLNMDSTLKGQLCFAAERASELIKPNSITDRTILDVMAFTRLSKSIPHYIAQDYEKLLSHLIPEYDYIFYISPKGLSIEDNGVREIDPEYRMEVDREIQNLITTYYPKIQNTHTLVGSTEERIQQIKEAIFS